MGNGTECPLIRSGWYSSLWIRGFWVFGTPVLDGYCFCFPKRKQKSLGEPFYKASRSKPVSQRRLTAGTNYCLNFKIEPLAADASDKHPCHCQAEEIGEPRFPLDWSHTARSARKSY